MPIIPCNNPPYNWKQGQRALTQLAAQFLQEKLIEPSSINLTEFRVEFELPGRSDRDLSILIDNQWPFYRDCAIKRSNQ